MRVKHRKTGKNMTTANGATRAPTVRKGSPADEVEEEPANPKVKPVTLAAGYSFTGKTLNLKGKPVT